MSMRLWKGKYSLSPVSCIPGNQENIQHPVLSHFDWALPSLNQTIQHGCKCIMWNKQFSTWPKVKATHGIQGCGSVYFFHKKNQSWNFILANKRMLQHFLMHGFNIGLHLWIIKYNWVQWFFYKMLFACLCFVWWHVYLCWTCCWVSSVVTECRCVCVRFCVDVSSDYCALFQACSGCLS